MGRGQAREAEPSVAFLFGKPALQDVLEETDGCCRIVESDATCGYFHFDVRRGAVHRESVVVVDAAFGRGPSPVQRARALLGMAKQ
ncbi:hypothetical protein GCM10010214_06640 [Streptomyces abikoensis]|nr:hypothetical protein GCM10010214_06640 [Streptomyces abikoensis]